MLQHVFFWIWNSRFEMLQRAFLDVAIVELRCCNMFFGCCNCRFKMLQHVFFWMCISRFEMLQHVFLNVATVDLRYCNMFFWMLQLWIKNVATCFMNVAWGFSILQTCVLECCKQWLTYDPFVSLSISLPHVRYGAVSASAIGSITTSTVVYYCITGEKREPEGDERRGGTGREKASRSEGNKRSGSLWIRKGRSARVERVEQKHQDRLLIFGRPGACIFPKF